MIRRPPVSTLTYTPYPYTTLCRSIERDIRDHKGNLTAAAGHRVNPLDFVAIKQDLIFVDGDDAAQVAWATSRYTDLKAKIIFVNGSPIEQMTARKRRFYFDQIGRASCRERVCQYV